MVQKISMQSIFFLISIGISKATNACSINEQDLCVCSNVSYEQVYDVFECLKTSTDLNELKKVYWQIRHQRNEPFGIKIRNKNFESIPENQFYGMDLVYLDLSRNEINNVFKSSFAGLVLLIELDLHYNNLKIVYITNLPKLKILKLDQNYFENLTSEFISNLPELKHLSNAASKLSFIQEDFFANFSNLQSVDLKDNQLSCWKNFGLSVKLTNLSIMYNQIEQIQSNSFRGLENLESLKISINEIRQLDSSLFNGLSRVKILNLAYLKLSNLDPSLFSGLVNLIGLTLEYNFISKIMSNLFSDSKQLKILYLNSNNINSIGVNAFTELNQLEIITLNDNQLTRLKSSLFSSLCRLRSLRLSANKIKYIMDGALPSCSDNSLLYLYLEYNKLEQVRNFYFPLLTKLLILSLNDNQISVIEAGSFRDLKNLFYLHLERNCIFHLDTNLFTSFIQLNKLFISANVMVKFEAKLFKSLNETLTELYLDGNLLSVVDMRVFQGFKVMKKIELQGNLINSITSHDCKTCLTSLYHLNFNNNAHKEDEKKSRVNKIEINNLSSLFLSGNSREFIAHFNLSIIKVLDLSFSAIDSTIMAAIPFSSCQKLYLVNMLLDGHQNGDRFIEAITNINLEELQISNALFSIKALRFFLAQSFKLKLLMLVNMSMSDLNSEIAIARFAELENLNLSYNVIKSIKENDFASNKNLEYLCLSNNRLSTIENRSFSELADLILLDVSFNMLKSITQDIFGENFLSFSFFFIFHHNQLETISFRRKNIDYSNIHSAFSYIYPAINSIIDLNLRKSFILVTMAQNKLKEVPTAFLNTFRSSTSSQVINLSGNRIEKIKSDSFRYTNPWTECIFLSNNLINIIEDSAFSLFQVLKYLDLSRNFIYSLNSRTFSELEKLESLNLSYNALKNLEGESFLNDLVSLISFDLSFNAIQAIEQNFFLKMTNLRNLYLNDNPVRAIFEEQILNGLVNLKNLYIPANDSYFGDQALSTIIDRFHPKFLNKSIGNTIYLDPVAIAYHTNGYDYFYTVKDCKNILFLIKFCVQLNLAEDLKFLSLCQKWATSAVKEFYQNRYK